MRDIVMGQFKYCNRFNFLNDWIIIGYSKYIGILKYSIIVNW